MDKLDERVMMHTVSTVEETRTETQKEKPKRALHKASSNEMLNDYVVCAREYGPLLGILGNDSKPEPAQRQALREDLQERRRLLVEELGESAVRKAVKERLEQVVYSYGCLACGEVPQERYALGRGVEGYPKSYANPYFEEAGLLLSLSKELGVSEHRIMLGEIYRTDPLKFLVQAEKKYSL